MKKEDLDLVAREMLDLIEGKTTSMAPEEEAPYYVDIKTYTDPDLFKREKKCSLRKGHY